MTRASRADLTPAELYGQLFARVQGRGVLPDGKTFVDAVAKRPIDEIMAGFDDLAHDDDGALLRFVEANFSLPCFIAAPPTDAPLLPLRDYIRSTWKLLARGPEPRRALSSALPIEHRHVVPGGRFREIYYWDSFFTMLGLVRDAERALAEGMVDAMTDLIEDHGYVPNGSRTYYLGRSQPPLFHMMVALLDDRRPESAARRLRAMKREHRWWMDGETGLAPGQQSRRVARLADGSLLNRYWDPRGTPREESWREDTNTAAGTRRRGEDVYRDLRAGAESGWDFSSRWLAGDELGTIRTTAIAPVDLNAFLFGLETAIADGGDADAEEFAERAKRRRAAMSHHMWDEAAGCFCDYDLETGARCRLPSAAALAPLLSGLATRKQADATARFVEATLLGPGGLRTSLVESGQQWDRPNGWAPLQWIAVAGLRRYGHDALANEIARRWIALVETNYARTGVLHEKYDVESSVVGAGGEYLAQIGFGWTNGVTADLIDMLAESQAPVSEQEETVAAG